MSIFSFFSSKKDATILSKEDQKTLLAAIQIFNQATKDGDAETKDIHKDVMLDLIRHLQAPMALRMSELNTRGELSSKSKAYKKVKAKSTFVGRLTAAIIANSQSGENANEALESLKEYESFSLNSAEKTELKALTAFIRP